MAEPISLALVLGDLGHDLGAEGMPCLVASLCQGIRRDILGDLASALRGEQRKASMSPAGEASIGAIGGVTGRSQGVSPWTPVR